MNGEHHYTFFPYRAATLVRRPERERRKRRRRRGARNHRLRCGRMRWYGGSKGVSHHRREPSNHALSEQSEKKTLHPHSPMSRT